MKLITITLAAILLSGCATIRDRNATTAADVRAGQLAAEEGRKAAAAAMDAVKDLKPTQ